MKMTLGTEALVLSPDVVVAVYDTVLHMTIVMV